MKRRSNVLCRACRGLVLWLGFTLLASTSLAVGVADEAEIQFQLGQTSYLRKDYTSALAHYFASNRLAPNRNVLFNIARCYEKLGALVEAYRYYNAYKDLCDNPRDLETAHGALARLQPLVALLAIETTPPGAHIYIDRRELGSLGDAPLHLAVPAGAHTVLVELPGYEDARRDRVSAEVGQTTEVKFELKAIEGTIILSGAPAGAEIHLGQRDGRTLGRVPAEIAIPPGPIRLVLTAPRHQERSVDLEVVAAQTQRVIVELVPTPGSLLIEADELDAEVWLDDTVVGFTPELVENIVPGAHRLRVAKPGFAPVERAVEVEAGQQQALRVSLVEAETVGAVSRKLESSREAPASVTLINRPELDALGPLTLAESVQGVRGLFPHDDQAYPTVGFRGLTEYGAAIGNRRVLIQLDGHNINDDWTGSGHTSFDLLPNLSMVDRVEVVRGAGSALYGTGAFQGVLNVVTPDRALSHTARATSFAAADGVFGLSADGGADFGPGKYLWIALGGAGRLPGDYFSAAHVGTPWAPDGVAHGVNDFVAGNVLAKAQLGDFTLVSYGLQRNKQIPTAFFSTTLGDTRNHLDDRRAFAEARYEPSLADWLRILSRAYLDHYHFEGYYPYLEPGANVDEYYEGDWGGVELRAQLTPGEVFEATAGGEYQMHFMNRSFGEYNSDAPPYLDEDHPFHVLSAYGVVELKPLDVLKLSAGGRYDAWWILGFENDAGQAETRFYHSFSPRLSAIFLPTPRDTLKLMGGKAFRAPSIYELSYWDGGLTQIQPVGLSPENIYSLELEYSRRFLERTLVSVDVFASYMTDFIELAGDGTAEAPFIYANQARPRWTAGVEVELRRELRRGTFFALSYSYQRTRLDAWWSDQVVQNSPMHTVGARAATPLVSPWLVLGTRVYAEAGRRYRDLRSMPPMLLWDLTLSGKVANSGLQYQAGVRNILDRPVEFPASQEVDDRVVRHPGRTLMLTLSYHL